MTEPILLTNVHITVSFEPHNCRCAFMLHHMGNEVMLHVFMRADVNQFTAWQVFSG